MSDPFGSLVGECQGCGGRYVLTMGFCGACVAAGSWHGDLPDVVPPSVPAPEPDPVIRKFVEQTLRAMDVNKARGKGQAW